MLDGEITEQWWDKGNPVERAIQLIKKYLKSEVMKNGVCVKTEEGSPQGGTYVAATCKHLYKQAIY